MAFNLPRSTVVVLSKKITRLPAVNYQSRLYAERHYQFTKSRTFSSRFFGAAENFFAASKVQCTASHGSNEDDLEYMDYKGALKKPCAEHTS